MLSLVDSNRFSRVFPAVLLALATAAVYGVTASFGLLDTLDDKYYIILNDVVKEITAANIIRAFSEYYVGNYAPVHILSYIADYSLWGIDSAGYHVENAVFHLLNGILFYVFLRRLSMAEWQAFASVWIFLFHPVQVETVAWVSQRKNILAMLFFLVAMIGYQAYISRKSGGSRQYILSIFSTVTAMLSKSVTVIIPVVLVLYDITHGRKETGRSGWLKTVDKLPYFLTASAIAVLAVVSQSESLHGGRRDFPGGSPLSTFYTMVPVLLGYIRDCFWPFALSPYYQISIRQRADEVLLLALAALLMLMIIGAWLYFKARPMFFWFGLFFIALVPVLQFVPLITLKNDRYLYFPLLGFSVLMVHATVWLQSAVRGYWHNAVRVVAVLVMLALPLFAFRQVLYWRDDVSVWLHAVEVDPENRLAWLQLAKGYTSQKDSRNAVYAFNRYHELRRKYGPVRGFEAH